jgi:hypothetical protein
MTEQPNPATGRPSPVVKHFSDEDEAWIRQFLHEKWLRDQIDRLVTARDQGFAEGLAKARAAAQARGVEDPAEWEAEVRHESPARRREWLIPALVAGGVAAEDVAAHFGVDVAEVVRLIAAKYSAHLPAGDVIDEASLYDEEGLYR